MANAIVEQLTRIYRAVHDGTVDVATVDDALTKIGVILDEGVSEEVVEAKHPPPLATGKAKKPKHK
jgi:hypothetical protein